MRWSGWLFDNLGLKLFALLLAVLLYLHVLTDRTIEQTVEFPLTLSELPESLALASAPPLRVAARLRGTGKQILRLRYLEPALDVSLAAATPGTYQRTFGPADVPIGEAVGVAVLEIVEPASMTLEVEPRSERRVPVAVTLSGSPLRGFAIAGSPVARPASVRLSGPARWLAAQESVTTQPVLVAGQRDTIELMLALVPPRFGRVMPGSVLVAVRIEPEETRSIQVPIEVRGIRAELSASAEPAAISVAWRGPRSQAGRAGAGAYRARVDAGRRGRGEWRLPVEITGPGLGQAGAGSPGGGSAAARPESVRVILH